MFSFSTNNNNAVPPHERVALAVFLALTGGFLDAYTYLLHGKVFANAQTGNMVLMGVRLAEGEFMQALYYFIPIVAFVLGIFVTELIKKIFKKEHAFLNWQQIILGLEAAVLLVIGFLPDGIPDVAVNVTVSFICSIQVQSFRRLAGTPYASTMCTGNLRSAAEHLYMYWQRGDKTSLRHSGRYFFIILCFCAGAAASGLTVAVWGKQSIWLASLLLMTAFVILLAGREINQK